MISSVIFLTLLGFLHGAPQQSKENLRIHNGDESNFPFVLYFRDETRLGSFACTASLIDSQYVLTAAHCLHPHPIRRTIIYGCSDLNSPNCKEVLVETFSVHQNYYGAADFDREDYDIAVLKLQYPLEEIQPIALPEDRESVPTGCATLVGYGMTEWSLWGVENTFQMSICLPLMEPGAYGASTEKLLVEHDERAIDMGDSGGPLIYNDTIYGVASTVQRVIIYGQLREFGVYMSVNYYRQFIETSIQDLEKEP